MRKDQRTSEFIRLLTSNQSRLYAYILSLLGNPGEAMDVLQETNLVLWRKSDEFEPGTDFGAWMLKVAYFQVMAWRRDRNRKRLVFDERILDRLSADCESGGDQWEQRQQALRECLGQLNARHRDLVRRRYSEGATINAIAADLGQAANTIKQVLFRARMNLIRCVRHKVA